MNVLCIYIVHIQRKFRIKCGILRFSEFHLLVEAIFKFSISNENSSSSVNWEINEARQH